MPRPARADFPEQRSSFVGRGKEIARIRSLLADHRLLTLTGMGGVGKTRLALRTVAEEVGRFSGGIFFVDLATLHDERRLGGVVASALGLAGGDGSGDAPVTDLIVDCLGSSSTLLLVDNCEHLLDPVAGLVDRLLSRCPGLVVCATSREPFGLEGERVFRVPSLSLPAEGSDVRGSEAVRLFLERAGAVREGFAPGPGELEAIARVCRKLDGIPLAIELAAARTSHLSAREIDSRLGETLHLLSSGRRRIGRHQTLEATLDWSHGLLSDTEQAVLRRLGVLPGTFDAAAAEGIAPDSTLLPGEILDLLGSLVEKSLIGTEDGPEGLRYRLLETVRVYALGKLREAGETEAYRSRHRDHYLARLEADPTDRNLWGDRQVRFCQREIHNLRAAAARSIEEDRPDLLGRLAARAAAGLGDSDSLIEAYAWLCRALEEPERLSPGERLACYAEASLASLISGDGRQVDFATRAIEIAGERPGVWLLAALNARGVGRGVSARLSGRPRELGDALSDFRRALGIARSERIPYWIATTLAFLAWVEDTLDSKEALAHLLEAREAMREEEGYEGVRAWVLSRLALTLQLRGRVGEALEAALAALEAQSASGTAQFRNHVVAHTSVILASGGRLADARRHLRSLLAPASRIRLPRFPHMLLDAAGAIAHAAGRNEEAARLLSAARDASHASNRIQLRGSMDTVLGASYAPRVKQSLEPEAFARAEAEGRAMRMDEAIRYALGTLDLLDEAAPSTGTARGASPTDPAREDGSSPEILRREGDYWSVTWKGSTCRIRDLRGLHYIRHLLDHPGLEFHAADLARLGRDEGEIPTRTAGGDGVAATLGDAGALLDARAKTAYRERLAELRSELAEARSFHDRGREEKLEAEVESLLRILASAVGLGGRDRKAASATERARVNVTRTIRDAMRKLEELAPDFGRYLARTIRTGTFCVYEPPSAVP